MEKKQTAVNSTGPSSADGRPRRKRLDDLLMQGSAINAQTADPLPDTDLAIVPFSLMDDFKGHPFQLYAGERKVDMVDSIREKGILLPLLLRDLNNGHFQVLSGHNRKYCGIEAGLTGAPAVIKRNLSDEDAWIYVIETNLIQRSFSDMLPSEQAAVLFTHYSKIFSQGKRSDIKRELEMLENPQNNRRNETCAQVGHKMKSRDVLAEQYGLSRNTVARFLRVQQLIPSLKMRLDAGEIAFIPAVALSFLKEREQRALDKCMKTNGFNVDMRKAEVLRAYSDNGTLDEGKIYMILNGELGQPPKKNRTPTVKVSKTLYARFFKPDQSAREIQDYVEKALCFYFEYQAQKNALRTKPRKSETDPGYDEPHDFDENEDDEDDWLEQ